MLTYISIVFGFNCQLRVLYVCVVTLHSCPILAMVALPVCSPSMAFSLKNRKTLSSSGLSLSGIKWTPTNLGSGGGKGKWIKPRNNTAGSQKCIHVFIHTWSIHKRTQANVLRSNLRPDDNPFTPILHLRNQIPRDILQSRLSNNSHSLYTLVLQYLTLPQVSAPSPNPT